MHRDDRPGLDEDDPPVLFTAIRGAGRLPRFWIPFKSSADLTKRSPAVREKATSRASSRRSREKGFRT